MTESQIPVRFHLSLNVSSIDQAVPFFERLLRTPAAKRRHDYAKFELDSPPLVLSLEPRSPREHGSLNHLGFRFDNSASLADAQKLLEQLGILTQREEGVECCYAKQTKFWVNDFDQRLWEFYVLEGDIDHRGSGQALDQMVSEEVAEEPKNEPIVWQHVMGSPFDLPAHPCDQILLRGTFNQPTAPELMAAMLKRTYAALVPGGKLQLHMLTCEVALTETPVLPGPAAYVKHVPVRTELMKLLEIAGFRDIELTTFRSGACFESQGQPLRETKIEAIRPGSYSQEACTVVFKGPFKELVDDAGRQWKRGEPTTISKDQWAALRESRVADLFVELPAAAPVSHCGTSREVMQPAHA